MTNLEEMENEGLDKEGGNVAEDATDVTGLQAALEEEKTKALHYLSNWQRTQADLVNYKKRSEQERQEAVKYENSLLVLKLLPVLDDLERALGSASGDGGDGSWSEGIKLIHRKLLGVLEAQGLSKVNALGETFDPAVHQAVMRQEGEENKVLGEVQKGYRFNGRLLRPAMVIVGEKREERIEKKEERRKKPEASSQ